MDAASRSELDGPTSSAAEPAEADAVPRLPFEVEDYLMWLDVERGRAAKTIEAYRTDLRGYVAWLADEDLTVAGAAEADLVRWLAELSASNRATSSVARALAAVRSMHRYCTAEGLLSVDPTAALEVPKVPLGLPKALSESDVVALIEAVEGNRPADIRDRSMLELLYGSGLRISEMTGLSLADIDIEGRNLRAFGKGAKERIIPIGSMAYDALVTYLAFPGRGSLEPKRWANRDDAEAVYLNQRGGRLSRQGAYGVVKKYGLKAGIGSKLSPHILRHSCATHMLDHGADIRTVQELLGHASITTTQVYTKVSQERLFEVHRSAHPRARAERSS